MGCVLCHRDEISQLNGRKEVFRHDKGVTSFLCSNCVQVLLQVPQPQIIKAYHSALEKGHTNLAFHLKSFIDEEGEDPDGPETREARSNMVRERTMHKTRPTRH